MEAAAVGESSNFADGLQAGAVAGLVDGSIDKILVAVAGVLAEPVGVNVGIVAVENGLFGKVRHGCAVVINKVNNDVAGVVIVGVDVAFAGGEDGGSG